jgi:hypothetical protein
MTARERDPRALSALGQAGPVGPELPQAVQRERALERGPADDSPDPVGTAESKHRLTPAPGDRVVGVVGRGGQGGSLRS